MKKKIRLLSKWIHVGGEERTDYTVVAWEHCEGSGHMTGCGGTYTILHIYKNYRTACQRVNFKIQIRKQTEKKENKQ